MKTFVIYVKNHHKSEAAAAEVLRSLSGFSGWEPELFEGLTPTTLPAWEAANGGTFPHKEKSRAAAFFAKDKVVYNAKKACSLNSYRLYKRCLEISEPIAILEHDVKCVGSWYAPKFSDVLILNARSGISHKRLQSVHRSNQDLIKNGPPRGVSPIKVNGLQYHHDSFMNGATVSIGAGALAVTPAGAAKLVASYEILGWEQTDLLVNTATVTLEVLGPELFTWNDHIVELSWGRGL